MFDSWGNGFLADSWIGGTAGGGTLTDEAGLDGG
jgi:hypothetical protein